MKKIGIVVAQEKECEGLLEKLGKYELIKLYGGFCVRKYTCFDNEIYFCASGIGEIRASIATQRLIDAFNIDVIINFGLAGGLKSGTRGNVYLVEGVVHYDFDTTPIDNAGRGRYECFDSAVIKTDKGLLETAAAIIPTAESVICASGDKFVADENFKNSLAEDFGAKICEMESAGVIITAKLNGVRAFVAKIVSDEDSHAEEYFKFLTEMTDDLNELILKLIRVI